MALYIGTHHNTKEHMYGVDLDAYEAGGMETYLRVLA